MIQKLNTKLRNTQESGVFHDSRADSRILIEVFNILHDKINEVIDELNKLKNERTGK
jgi:hypothetical protein